MSDASVGAGARPAEPEVVVAPTKRKLRRMDRLLKIGFRRFGYWEVVDDRLRCQLDEHARHSNCLYAFIADAEILYVGKTTATLIKRMSGYAAEGNPRSTNGRSNKRIRKFLMDGKAVEIYVLPDEGLVSFGPFNMNLAAALEDSIIRTVSPRWNGGRAETLDRPGADEPADISAPEAEVEAVGDPLEVREIRVVLHPTYAQTGFFNIGVAGADCLGADGQVLEIFLGDAEQPILASINRRANSNKSPRIMGGKGLRDWLTANVRPMAGFIVHVLAPTSIRITAAGDGP